MEDRLSKYLVRAAVAEEDPATVDTTPPKGRFKLHGVKIAFDATNPKKPSVETFSKAPSKELEANFMWVQYNILFTDDSGEDLAWYIYQTAMDPWGTLQTAKKNGSPVIIKSDSKWQLHKSEPVTITPADVEQSFDVVKQSDRDEAGQRWLHPKEEVTYLNLNKSDRGHLYSSNEFKQYFNKDFYVVLTEGKKYVNPFGKPIGHQGKPEDEQIPEEPMKEEQKIKFAFDEMKIVEILKTAMTKTPKASKSSEEKITGVLKSAMAEVLSKGEIPADFESMRHLYEWQKAHPGETYEPADSSEDKAISDKN